MIVCMVFLLQAYKLKFQKGFPGSANLPKNSPNMYCQYCMINEMQFVQIFRAEFKMAQKLTSTLEVCVHSM